MTVYIEVVILNSMVMNALLLIFTAKTLKISMSKLRIFLVALIGTVLSIFLSLMKLNELLSVVLKLLIAFAMCIFMQKRMNIKQFIRIFSIFCMYTFVLGGAIYAFMSIFSAVSYLDGKVVFNNKIPLFLYLLAVLFVCWCIFQLLRHIKVKAKGQGNIVVRLNNKSLNAFIDTGNSLYYDHLPVCFVVNKKIIKKLQEKHMHDVINEQSFEYKNIEFITLGGQTCANAKKQIIEINGEFFEVYIAWNNESSSSGAVDLVLPNHFYSIIDK